MNTSSSSKQTHSKRSHDDSGEDDTKRAHLSLSEDSEDELSEEKEPKGCAACHMSVIKYSEDDENTSCGGCEATFCFMCVDKSRCAKCDNKICTMCDMRGTTYGTLDGDRYACDEHFQAKLERRIEKDEKEEAKKLKGK